MGDPSVLEAASWRLASELVRRHPKDVRLIRRHPGGGQYDCLSLMATGSSGASIELNRNGTIQIHGRFDGRSAPDWEKISWEEYLWADPREFVNRIEVAAGLSIPPGAPPTTPVTLTYRILAAITATAFKSVHPIEIQAGYIDSSTYGGANELLGEFVAIPPEPLRPRPDDLLGQAGYRFWIVVRDSVPVLAFEQSDGLAWTTHHGVTFSTMELYEESRRQLLVTALKLLRKVDHI